MGIAADLVEEGCSAERLRVFVAGRGILRASRVVNWQL